MSRTLADTIAASAKRKRLVAEAALVAFVCERVARGYCPVCERYSSDAGVDHLDTCEYAAFTKALLDAIQWCLSCGGACASDGCPSRKGTS